MDRHLLNAMRVAALYDIHGNLPALEAVLDEIGRIGVDRVVVGGDVVPGPMPGETLAALLSLEVPTHYIQGNGERDTISMLTKQVVQSVPEQAREVVAWVGRVLSPDHLRLLQSWPATVRLTVAGLGNVLFCHATPRSDREIFTARTAEEHLLPVFAAAAADIVVCGHTHMQFDRTVGSTRVVNAGSVGMPFGAPGAYWVLLGPDVELRHTPYDLPAAAGRVRASSYPWAAEFAVRNVERPPPAAAMMEIFDRAALT